MSFMEFSDQNGIATLTLARGNVNAMNEEMVDHLIERFQRLSDYSNTHAVVLTGQGSFFSFGLDVPELYDYSSADFTRFLSKFTDLYLRIFEFPKPLIAAINGHAVAGGFMLAMPCDYRIMATGKAKISLNEITFGSSVFAGSIEILKCVTGHRNAEVFALGGKMYSAEEAKSLGLVDEVVQRESVLSRALEIAGEMAARDLVAYGAIKKLLRGPVVDQIRRTEADSIRRFVEIWYLPSTREKTKGIVIR
ncbi:MAG: enoyl-CoA hydratase/isomerase family protein [Candidatus Zixiibacteriota bacterium]